MNISYDDFSYEDLSEDLTNEEVCTLSVKSCPHLSKNMDNTPFSTSKTSRISKELNVLTSGEKPKNSL